jgi:uncharacterized iron-regulated membrane protein
MLFCIIKIKWRIRFIYDSSYEQGNKTLELFIDPYNARIIGQRGGANDPKRHTMAWVAALHQSFLLGKKGNGYWALLESFFY